MHIPFVLAVLPLGIMGTYPTCRNFSYRLSGNGRLPFEKIKRDTYTCTDVGQKYLSLVHLPPTIY